MNAIGARDLPAGSGRGMRPGGRRAAAVIAAGVAVLGLVACQAPAVGGPERATPATGSPALRRAASAPSRAQGGTVRPAGMVPGRWHLVFSDAFAGRALNERNWSTGWLARGVTPPVNPRELECYAPGNVTVAGGALHLTLTARPRSCGGKTRPYSSGLVNTDGKFAFTYGFLQARIWLPGQRGQIVDWPAFWADGQHWPTTGEIDVVEGLGGRACWHFVNPVGARGGCAAGIFADGWHTFGADWEPGSVTFYYDGRAVGTITSGITHAPMYLILKQRHRAAVPHPRPRPRGHAGRLRPGLAAPAAVSRAGSAGRPGTRGGEPGRCPRPGRWRAPPAAARGCGPACRRMPRQARAGDAF